MVKLIEVKSLPGYKLELKYADGKQGIVDVSYITRDGVFEIWNQPGEFEKVYLEKEVNAPTWNEQLDLDPFNLYLKLIGKTFEEYQKEKNMVADAKN